MSPRVWVTLGLPPGSSWISLIIHVPVDRVGSAQENAQ